MKIALLSLFLLFAIPIVAFAQSNFCYAEEFSTSTSISSSSVPSSDSCCSSGSGGGSSSSSSGSSSSGGGGGGSGKVGTSCYDFDRTNYTGCTNWILTQFYLASAATVGGCSLEHPDVPAGSIIISARVSARLGYGDMLGNFIFTWPGANSHDVMAAHYVGTYCVKYVFDPADDPDCSAHPADPSCSDFDDGEGGSSSSSSSDEPSSSSNDEPSSSSSDNPSSSSSDEPSSSSSDEPSSSSSDEPSSSSSDEPSSSSSDEPSYSSSSSKPESSSSSEMSSDSNSGSGGDVCVASKPFLQKPASYYDDWVYMGKETYGNRHVSGPTKFSTKFFDALGRAYDKMKTNIKYYVFKEAIESRHKVALEFEVYMRVIKDSDGNDVRVFVKEDKKRGLRRDSSFYWNGSWEVMEKNDVTRTIKSKTSLGVKIVSLHDNQWRVTSNVMTNKYNDTVAYDRYFWKNGRLSKTIFNGVKRIFIYGKTLQDTVKVVPNDKNVYPYHPGYDNSAGIIPDESDLEYKYFLMSPYSVYKVPQNVSKAMPMLFKQYNKVAEVNGLNVIYKHPVFENCTNKDSIYLYGESRGHSGFEPNLNSECQVGYDGCFRLDYNPEPVGKFIELYQSHIKYDKTAKKWREYCVSRSELDSTYFHEITHLGNGKIVLADYARKYMPSKTEAFTTRDLCESARQEGKNTFIKQWDAWKMREKMHCNGGNYSDETCRKGNGDPKSPWLRPFRLGELCDESD